MHVENFEWNKTLWRATILYLDTYCSEQSMFCLVHLRFVRTTPLTIIRIVLTRVVNEIPAQIFETDFQRFPATPTGTLILVNGPASYLPDTSHCIQPDKRSVAFLVDELTIITFQ